MYTKTFIMKMQLTVCAIAVFIASCNNADTNNATKETVTTDSSVQSTPTSNEIPALSKDSASMAEMMKAWQDFSTPGPEHEWMAKSAGTWVCDSIAQFMDPSQPPTYAKGTDVTTMIMNGLYQMTDFTSTMMGMPMKGHGIMGYDKMKKKFVMDWVDNMGSGIVRMEGDYDATSKILNMKGKQSDPTRKMETDIRQQIKFNDDGSYTMSMFGTGHDGKSEQKFMEGTFKKAKK